MAGLRGVGLSPQIKAEICRDRRELHMTYTMLAVKYNVSYNTARKTCDRDVYGFEKEIIEQAKIFNSVNKDMVSRPEIKPITDTSKDLSKDVNKIALNVVALTLQNMEYLLTNHPKELTAPQLAQFMSAAAPYAVGKVEGRKKGESAGKQNVFKMFKENLKQQDAKVNSVQRN